MFHSGGFSKSPRLGLKSPDKTFRVVVERVGSETVAAVFVQFVGEVNYADGFEGAFFDAYTAATAEHLGDYGFFAFHAYGFHSTSHHRTEAYA